MSEEKKGFWGRLVSGLSKTRENIVSGMDSIFNGFSHMRISMRSLKRFLLWGIWEFRQSVIFWTI